MRKSRLGEERIIGPVMASHPSPMAHWHQSDFNWSPKIGIEVKASATVTSADFSGMRRLAEACGDRFAFGMVLYDHDQIVPFGERMIAAPLSCLW